MTSYTTLKNVHVINIVKQPWKKGSSILRYGKKEQWFKILRTTVLLQ